MSVFAALNPMLSTLPSSWQILSLRRAADLIEVPNSDATAELLSLLSASGTLAQRDPENQPPSAEYLKKYYLVEPGDLVVNPMWLIGGGVGVSSTKGAVSPDYRVYRPAIGIEPRYLHHLVRSQPYREQYNLLVRANTTFDRRISKRDLAELPVAVPPIDQQRVIANFLDRETTRIDALVVKKQQLNQLLKERLSSAMDNALLSAKGPERPIMALADYVNGWPFKPIDLGTEGLPVIRIQQLVNPEVEPDRFEGELPGHVKLNNGDLVFSWSGSLHVRCWSRGPAWLNQHLFRVVPASGIKKSWLFYALTTATRLFEPFMHGSAMTHITKPMMKAVRIPVPPSRAQQNMAEKLDELWHHTDSLVGRLSDQIKLLSEHRQALITAAVTGQLEIPGVAA